MLESLAHCEVSCEHFQCSAVRCHFVISEESLTASGLVSQNIRVTVQKLVVWAL